MYGPKKLYKEQAATVNVRTQEAIQVLDSNLRCEVLAEQAARQLPRTCAEPEAGVWGARGARGEQVPGYDWEGALDYAALLEAAADWLSSRLRPGHRDVLVVQVG